MPTIIQYAVQMDLDTEARALLRGDMAPGEAVQALLDAGRNGDAMALLARLLPKRFVVAWVCQCARGEELPMEARAGASLAEKWARDPTEENRRAAFEFANAGDYETLGAWIAATAGWAGGSLAPVDQVVVAPAEHLAAVAAVAAINMLADLDEDNFDERRLAFIKRALGPLGQTAGAAGAATKQT